MIIAFIFVLSLLSSYTTYGQQCQGTSNTGLTGHCSSVNNCQGTVLASNSCGENKCCINGTPMPSTFRRRGFFGLRGKEMYTRLQIQYPQYQTLSNPESAALLENSAVIASLLWKNSNLQNGNTQIYDHTNEIV